MYLKKKDRNLNTSELFLSILSYLIWLVILIFWGVVFNFFLGKKIGFAAGIVAIIFAYATIHAVEPILKKLRKKK